MSEQQSAYPASWQRDDAPLTTMLLSGKQYLTVAHRIAWFQQEQRALITAGLATQPYRIQIVTQETTDTYAKYTLRVEDVLGNVIEATGSETKGDFKDFDEKAYTKAIGRALALMGYSTVEAMERDDGEVIADAPQARKPQPSPAAAPHWNKPNTAPVNAPPPISSGEPMATERQIASIGKLCAALERPPLDTTTMTFATARAHLTNLSAAYSEARQS